MKTQGGNVVKKQQPPPLVLKGRPSPKLEWEKWELQFSWYSMAINLKNQPPKQQVDIFKKVIGPEGVDLLYQFNLTESERSDINVIMNRFTSYFQRNIVRERHTFNKLYQRPYISFDTFLDTVCTAADSCDFGSMKDELIRDKLVTGIHSEYTRKKLLNKVNLTLDEAIDICRTNEEFPLPTYLQWVQSCKRRHETRYQTWNRELREADFIKRGKQNKCIVKVDLVGSPGQCDDEVKAEPGTSNEKMLVDTSNIKKEIEVPDAGNTYAELPVHVDNIKKEAAEEGEYDETEIRTLATINNLIKDIYDHGQ